MDGASFSPDPLNGRSSTPPFGIGPPLVCSFVRTVPMLRRRLLVPVLVLMLGLPLGASASGPTGRADTTTVAVDSAQVDVRRPSDAALARFRNDPAFNYEQTPSDWWVWWQDLERRVAGWIDGWLAWLGWEGVAGGDDLFEVVFYLVIAGLVGYAVYMLVQLRSDARAPGRTAPDTIARPQTAEEMQAIDFDARLAAAVEEGQHRRAVRLLYQQALQRLDEAGAIAWRPGKTNRAYVQELDEARRPAFAGLTRRFEQVWYGGAAVDAERFEQIRRRFASFWADDETPDAAPTHNTSHSSPAAA